MYKDVEGSNRAASLLKNLVSAKVELASFRKNLQKDWLELHHSQFEWEACPSFKWTYIPELYDLDQIVVGYFAGEAKWIEPVDLPLTPVNGHIAYPRIKNERLRFSICERSSLVTSTTWGVLEAPRNLDKVTPDLIFVPASAVDLKGKRIGKGGGFYDRFIRKNPQVVTCAVIHSRYLFEELPNRWFHTGDEKIKYILTEKNFIKIEESSP
jgi:5-formyltetrahydrofolate cyclo-ligase